MKSDFIFFLDLQEKSFNQFLKFSLDKDKYFNHFLVQAGVIAVDDILKAIDEKFSKYINEYLPLLLTILTEEDVKKEVKLNVITIIGEIFFNTRNESVNYLKQTMEILFGACGLALTPCEEDAELEEYLQNLRYSLIQTFTLIFFGLDDCGQSKLFSIYVPHIFDFIKSLVIGNNNLVLKLENYYQIMGFIMDMFNVYGNEIQKIIDYNILAKLLSLLKASNMIRYTKYAEECENSLKLIWK